MKIYFYAYEHSIERNSGIVEEEQVHCATIEPTGEYGEVLLGTQEVTYLPPNRAQIAQAAIYMLGAKADKIKAESISKLEAIEEKLVVYKALEAPVEAA